MKLHLFDSELKVMELIWLHGAISAKELSLLAAKQIGWNKNTTYTIIKKLEEKGYIDRAEPGFICSPRISREDVRRFETRELVNKLFDGSRKALFSALLQDEELTQEDIDALRSMIETR